MARWSANFVGTTLTAVADTVNMTNGGYCALQGGSSTQRINILEVFMGGMGTASVPTAVSIARDH